MVSDVNTPIKFFDFDFWMDLTNTCDTAHNHHLLTWIFAGNCESNCKK